MYKVNFLSLFIFNFVIILLINNCAFQFSKFYKIWFFIVKI